MPELQQRSARDVLDDHLRKSKEGTVEVGLTLKNIKGILEVRERGDQPYTHVT